MIKKHGREFASMAELARYEGLNDLPLSRSLEADELPESITSDEGLRKLVTMFRRALRRQEDGRRVARLLDAATRLYPYVTQVFDGPLPMATGADVLPNDTARSARCVEIAVGMETMIQAHIEKETA